MPATRTSGRLVSAALRHMRDAEQLLTNSPDQAWHLAGFGPECMRKAVLTLHWAGKVLGHSIDGNDGALIDLLCDLDPHARRHQSIASIQPTATLAQWGVNHRYEATGTRSEATARPLVEHCRAQVDSRLAELWASGILPADGR